jgi:predicted nuclease of predicted toxin-antitoxin system
MFQLLANENIMRSAVDRLRSRGHDVAWVREDSPGIDDATVLDRARRESRILITFDKDFGELVFRKGLSGSCGVVLFRLATPDPATSAEMIAAALESRSDWVGHFAVIDDSGIRMVPLP